MTRIKISSLCTHLSLGECPCSKKRKSYFGIHIRGIKKRARIIKENQEEKIITHDVHTDIIKEDHEEITSTYDVQNIFPHLSIGECFSCAKVDAIGKKRIQDINQEEEEDEEEENKTWGYSTKLVIYDDPWKIKKILKNSDIGNLSRLLISKDIAEKLVLPVLNEEAQNEAKTGKATQIIIWDVDTDSMHHLMFKLWGSSKSYIFLGNWNRDFVERRDLKKGDEIGLQWNPYNNCFNFSVLLRA